jgi:hypothetical protein
MELARAVDATDCEDFAAETVMIALLAVPFQVAVRMIHPVGKLVAVTVKATEADPVGTITLAGVLKATLLVEIATLISPAAFERFTVQMPLAPTVNAFGLQVSDTSVGVDHNANVTV